jgi:hypothetical protein
MTSLLNVLLLATIGAVNDAEAPGQIMAHKIDFINGITVHISTVVDPSTERAAFWPRVAGGIQLDKKAIRCHRLLYDRTKKLYFGYDLEVQPIERGERVRVTFKPLGLTIAEIFSSPWKLDSGFQSVVIPKYPAPQIIDNGDGIALELLVSTDDKARLVDYLSVNVTGGRR